MTEKEKKYEAPEMEVHQVESASIICTSGTQSATEALTEEEYGW